MILFHIKFGAAALATLALVWTCSKERRRDLLVWAAPVAVSAIVFVGLTLYLYGPDLIHGLTISSGPGGFLGGGPFWGVFGLYLDRAWGLFIFAPLYFIFLPGVPVPRHRKDLGQWWVFLPLVIVLQTLAVGLFGKWSGEVSPIPRHLVPLLPVFVLCAALFYERLKSVVAKAVIWVLVACQIVCSVFALIYPMSVFAIHGPANVLIPTILGNNALSRLLVRLFPLFHPVGFKSTFLLLAIWLVVLVGVSLFLRRRAMTPLEERLVAGGYCAV
jgi:hypothetical protein